MTFKTLAVAGSAMALALTGVAPAFAQAPAAAVAPQATHGAPVPGVCVFSGDAVIGTSSVGKFVIQRLQQLAQQANAEVQAEQTALNTEANALNGQRATLDQGALEGRAATLQVRANALERKAQQRQAEMQRTQEKAFGRLNEEISPMVRQAYQAKGCSMSINREALTLNLANPAMDITLQVITALNAKITQFAFDRERLDPSAAGTAPAAAPRR